MKRQGEDARLPWRLAVFQGVGAAFVAAFCYATASLVRSLPQSYWAPIAAVVVLYPDTASTKKAAIQRVLGTLVGSLIGWGSATWWHQNVLIYGLSILVAVGLCHLARLEGASRLCAVAVTVITIIPRSEPPYLVALHRFVEVSYGLACALLYMMAVDYLRRRWRRAR
ncbi:MAG: FUSC family protein [Polyangia bacterium]|jgi:uncharacterized membrane protein YgaE (UPF0421/DUF939 family)